MNDTEGVGLLRDIRDDMRKLVGFMQRTQADQQEAQADIAQHEAEKAEFARNP
jgi:hypothetical protein